MLMVFQYPMVIFYCESSSFNNPESPYYIWHTSDPLWDGMQHEGDEATILDCPGLTRTHTHTPLPLSMYVSVSEDTSSENLGVKHLELFVK